MQNIIGDFPIPVPTEAITGVASAVGSLFAPLLAVYESALVAIVPNNGVAQLRDFVDFHTHPLSRGMPLTDPVVISFAILVYFVLLAVFYLIGRVVGKLELRGFGILYNFVCVVMSFYMCIGFAWEALTAYDGLWNNPVSDVAHPRAVPIRNMLLLFFGSKMLEYTDTYIMVLKHNYRQVSFLHLYHHASVVLYVYTVMIVAPGGDSYFLAMLNSGIHAIMYSYYLLNLLFSSGPVKSLLQRNKLMITKGQLLQFVADIIQALFVLFVASPKRYSLFMMVLQVIYISTMIVLFNNFMTKNSQPQGKPKSAKKQD